MRRVRHGGSLVFGRFCADRGIVDAGVVAPLPPEQANSWRHWRGRSRRLPTCYTHERARSAAGQVRRSSLRGGNRHAMERRCRRSLPERSPLAAKECSRWGSGLQPQWDLSRCLAAIIVPLGRWHPTGFFAAWMPRYQVRSTGRMIETRCRTDHLLPCPPDILTSTACSRRSSTRGIVES